MGAKAASEKIAMGMPRSSLAKRSLRVPPTSAMAVDPPMPDMNRTMRMVWMFVASACGIWKMPKTKAEMM